MTYSLWQYYNEDGVCLNTGNAVILVDTLDFSLLHDLTLQEGKHVTMLGEMGGPKTSTSLKFIAEKIVAHEAIAGRAYQIFISGNGGTAEQNWLRAERELLGISDQ